MIILGFIAIIVLSEADILLPQLKTISSNCNLVCSCIFFIGTIMNTITRSKIERIWAPVALIQMITALIIGIG